MSRITLRDFQDGLVDLQGGQELDRGTSERFWTSRGTLEKVWDGSGDTRGGPGLVEGP